MSELKLRPPTGIYEIASSECYAVGGVLGIQCVGVFAENYLFA
jgi:hypothetical protein